METVTPKSSMRSSLKTNQRKFQKKGYKCSNPFLDADAVVNPFMNYERSFLLSSGSQSTTSSSSTLFDGSNPFNNKRTEEIKRTKKKPSPPKRISSLSKHSVEDNVTNEVETKIKDRCQDNISSLKFQEDPNINIEDISVDKSSKFITTPIVIDDVTEANESNETESTANIAELEQVLPSPSSGDTGVTETDGVSAPEPELSNIIEDHQTNLREFLMHLPEPVLSQVSYQQELENGNKITPTHFEAEKEKPKGSQNVFGRLKKQFNSWMTKTTNKKDEKDEKKVNNLPWMTSTPVQRCQSFSVGDRSARGEEEQTASVYNCGGDLPPLYRTIALKRQHQGVQRWSFAGAPPPDPLMSADQFYYTVPGPAYQYQHVDQGPLLYSQQYYYPSPDHMMKSPISNTYCVDNSPQTSPGWNIDMASDPVTVTTQNFLGSIPSTGDEG